MEQPQDIKKQTGNTNAVSAKTPGAGSVWRQRKTPCGAASAGGKGEGDHLGCSPCGVLACPHGGVARMAVAGPEVLLSLLPEALDYTGCRKRFWTQPAGDGRAAPHWKQYSASGRCPSLRQVWQVRVAVADSWYWRR